MDAYILVDIVWLVVILVLAAVAHGFGPRWRPLRRVLGWLDRSGVRIFLLACLMRLVPQAVPAGLAYDVNSYLVTGQAVLHGEGIYASGLATAHYPYLPLALYWWTAAVGLSLLSGLPFVAIVKLPMILADGLLAGLLARVGGRGRATGQFSAGVLYAVSPIAILVSAYHGQFDGVVLLALLASLWLSRSPSTVPQALRVGFLAGIAVALKPWPLVFIPSSLLRLRRTWPMVVYLATMASTIGVLLVIYLTLLPDRLQSILSVVSSYRSLNGVWGLSWLLWLATGAMPSMEAAASLMNSYGYVLLGVALLAASLLFWRAGWPWPRAGMGLVLVFMVFTNAFALQYTVWIVPFALLSNRRRELAVYTIACLAWIIPWSFLWYIFPVLQLSMGPEERVNMLVLLTMLGLIAWIAACWWLIREVARVRSSLVSIAHAASAYD